MEEKLGLEQNIKVRDLDELKSLLSRAYWIETEFELGFQWEAYSSLDEEHRDLIFQLSHDSYAHKGVLKKVIKNIDGITIDEIKATLKRKEFEFKPGWTDSEVFSEILKYDSLAKDIYLRIKNYTSEELVDEVWKGEDTEMFFRSMTYLIKEEEKHIDMLKSKARKVGRIR